MTYINKKTGKKYTKVFECVNTTNSDDGKIMVLYHPVKTKAKMFVRELNEFNEKFETVT